MNGTVLPQSYGPEELIGAARNELRFRCEIIHKKIVTAE